jgi:hypothetical protein
MENNNSKNDFSFNNPAVIVLTLFLVFVGGYLFFNKNQTTQLTQENTSTNSQQNEIDSLKKEVESLKGKSTPTLTQAPKTNDLSSVISFWHPRIAFVSCSFQNTTGVIYLIQNGSGTLTYYPNSSDDYKYAIVTNRHVAFDSSGNKASYCDIAFPSDSEVVKVPPNYIGTGYLNGDGTDIAWLNINNPDNYILTTGSKLSVMVANCKNKPDIGASIVILGYPAIGSRTDITATEGIISGYDGNYYITSAKIEHGNSGGAAIDVKNNCYLGLPTWAATGEVESLGRILKW